MCLKGLAITVKGSVLLLLNGNEGGKSMSEKEHCHFIDQQMNASNKLINC